MVILETMLQVRESCSSNTGRVQRQHISSPSLPLKPLDRTYELCLHACTASTIVPALCLSLRVDVCVRRQYFILTLKFPARWPCALVNTESMFATAAALKSEASVFRLMSFFLTDAAARYELCQIADQWCVLAFLNTTVICLLSLVS
jgi:hypothetical protein